MKYLNTGDFSAWAQLEHDWQFGEEAKKNRLPIYDLK